MRKSPGALFGRLCLLCLGVVLLHPFEARGDLGSEGAGGIVEEMVAPLLAAHPGQSGMLVLEKGEQSLLARAWLADHARRSIDVQYFIWSTDNIGILAAEALLRAAERGVKVRVLVDDLLIDAPPDSLLALSAHPCIEIRIYNPMHSVGVSRLGRVGHLLTDFRDFNQRMHNKTFSVDGRVAITGGRNMADEYFDYDHRYNFRDRDVLLVGPVVADLDSGFESFWQSPLSVQVEGQLKGKLKGLKRERVEEIFRFLHDYAGDPANFAPEVRRALEDLPGKFPPLLGKMAWGEIRFITDLPGKNDVRRGLGGGGESTRQLVEALREARRRVTIQSPYLVMPEGGLEFFRDLVARGVEVRISTNSLASTDNLQAFGGYRKQRRALLKAGIQIYEFRPDPVVLRSLVDRYPSLEEHRPVFALHAKTLVIDGETLYVGTFNLDPRSANLNTETGVMIRHPALASEVEAAIEEDMAPGNSWNPRTENPDAEASPLKRFRLFYWKALPLDPLL